MISFLDCMLTFLQRLQERDETIATLREQGAPSKPSEGTSTAKPLPPVPFEPEPTEYETIKMERDNLKREITLMASAWYDQSTRLIGNPGQFSRGRQGLEHRSLLGRQRRLVGDVVMGRE